LDAEGVPEPNVPEATQALIERAESVVNNSDAGVGHVRGLMQDLEAAIRAGDDTLRDDLSEQLAEALFDLES